MSRTTVPLLVGLLFVPVAEAAPRIKDKSPPAPSIVGEWVRVGHTKAGTPVAPDHEPHHQLFKADGGWEYTYGPRQKSPAGMTYATDPKQSPPAIDISQNSGIPPNWRGVYKVEGDTLTLCLVTGGGDRPKNFESSADRPTTVWVFKRVKAKED